MRYLASDAPIRPLHRARKPILHISPQLRIHRELRRLGTLSTTLSVSLGGRGSIFNAATSDRGIALQLSGDHRRRTAEPTRDLSHPTTTREQDRDLLPLGERQIRPDTGTRARGGTPPPLRNHRTPMLGNTPASTAAFSLDTPRAIASQNRTRCSRRPAGGCPPQRVPAAAARLHARFLLAIATPHPQALRQPVESTPSSTGHKQPDPTHPTDTPPETGPDPSDQPPPEPSTPNDPQATTQPATAAATTPGRVTRNEISSHTRKCRKPGRRHRYSDSLPRTRSHDRNVHDVR